MGKLKWKYIQRSNEYEARTIFDRYRIEAANFTSEFQAECERGFQYDIERLALANGYVKLADDEMVVKRLETGEVCFGTVNVDEMARKFGYVRLQPGQVVVDGKAIVDYCGACDDESLTVVCDGCVIKPIRDAIKEARDGK